MSTLEQLLELASSPEPDELPIQNELTYGDIRRVIELLRRVVRARDIAEQKLAQVEQIRDGTPEQTPARILRNRS